MKALSVLILYENMKWLKKLFGMGSDDSDMPMANDDSMNTGGEETPMQ